MSDPIISHPRSGEGRKFNWMPVLDGYILRSFLIPFGILLFAFTLLFIIMDMYNEIGDFLEHDAPLPVSVHFFSLKIPGNIRFILPITVLLANMYALANLGRNRELTAIRASGISLMRCGMPIFAVGFCVMLVNFYFNEKLVPDTMRQAEIVRKKISNPNYVEETNARLLFLSGDRRRNWYVGQFYDEKLVPDDSLPATEHIVKKDDSLSSISRKYYSDSSGWKLIFDRNKALLSDTRNASAWNPSDQKAKAPDKIKMKLEIPAVRKISVPYLEKVMLTFFQPDENTGNNHFLRPIFRLSAEEALFTPGASGKSASGEPARIVDFFTDFFSAPDRTGFWEFDMAQCYNYSKDIAGADGRWVEPATVNEVIESFAEYGFAVDCIVEEAPRKDTSRTEAGRPEKVIELRLTLVPSEKDKPGITIKENVPFSLEEIREMSVGPEKEGELYNTIGGRTYCFSKMRIPQMIILETPREIAERGNEAETLSSYRIYRIWRDDPRMAKNLKHIYATIFFNRLAFPWACFLCAFFALPLATKNERSGIFTAIATAVGIAVLYQVLNEIFMVVGKNGYLSFDLIEDFIHFPLGACIAGFAPTFIFGGYGIYLLKKVG